jgi:hypothetical protein
VLLKAKRYDGSYYICGYAVELALKARICRTLGWAGFPSTAREFEGLGSVKTHDLEVLLKFSGVQLRLRTKYMPEWSVVSNWNQERRYQTTGVVTVGPSDGHPNCGQATPGGPVIVTDILEQRLERAMRDISAVKGPFALFALVSRVGSTGTWELVVSASWLKAGKLRGLSEFVEMLEESAGTGTLEKFSRVVTVEPDSPLVRFFVKNLPVDDEPAGSIHAQSPDLLRFDIDEAIVFRAAETSRTGGSKRSTRQPKEHSHR